MKLHEWFRTIGFVGIMSMVVWSVIDLVAGFELSIGARASVIVMGVWFFMMYIWADVLEILYWARKNNGQNHY